MGKRRVSKAERDALKLGRPKGGPGNLAAAHAANKRRKQLTGIKAQSVLFAQRPDYTPVNGLSQLALRQQRHRYWIDAGSPPSVVAQPVSQRPKRLPETESLARKVRRLQQKADDAAIAGVTPLTAQELAALSALPRLKGELAALVAAESAQQGAQDSRAPLRTTRQCQLQHRHTVAGAAQPRLQGTELRIKQSWMRPLLSFAQLHACATLASYGGCRTMISIKVPQPGVANVGAKQFADWSAERLLKDMLRSPSRSLAAVARTREIMVLQPPDANVDGERHVRLDDGTPRRGGRKGRGKLGHKLLIHYRAIAHLNHTRYRPLPTQVSKRTLCG